MGWEESRWNGWERMRMDREVRLGFFGCSRWLRSLIAGVMAGNGRGLRSRLTRYIVLYVRN